METVYLFWGFAVFMLLQSTGKAEDGETLDELASSLRTILTDGFSKNRHHDTNEVNKDNVRNYIIEAFKSHGLNVQLQPFSSLGHTYNGVNIIGILPGQLQGTAADKVVLLGAHYDTVNVTYGIDDNGSGMAVLLESVYMYRKENEACKQMNTVVFVAFDLEEYQEAAGDICIGSYHFVNDWLIPFLRINRTTNSQFQGALVMETVLNYNKVDNTQAFPDGVLQLFPTVGQHLIERNFRGDFLSIIGRRDDLIFASAFASSLYQVNLTDVYTEMFELPIEGIPTDEERYWYGDFFRSDHIRFWEHGLSALFITDTANFRTPMNGCYHKTCDNTGLITHDNLLFLARTTEAAVNTLRELSMDCPTGGGNLATPLHLAILLLISLSTLYW